MKPSLYYISVKLSEFSPACVIHSPERAEVKQFSLLAEAAAPYDDETLYLTDAEYLRMHSLADLPANIIYVSDTLADVPDYCNHIRLGAAPEYEQILQATKDVAVYVNAYFKLMVRLLNYLGEKNELQNVVDDICQTFSVNMVIHDTSFRRIVSNTQLLESPKMEYMAAMYDNDYLSKEVMKVLDRQGRLEFFQTSGKYNITCSDTLPEEIQKRRSEKCYLDIPLKIENTSFAFAVVTSDERIFDETDGDCFWEIGKALCLIMQSMGLTPDVTGNFHDALIHDILDERIAEKDVIALRFKALGISLEKNLYVIVATLPEADTRSIYFMLQRQKELRLMIGNSVSTIYNGKIILLTYKKDFSKPINENDSRLTAYLEINDMRLGVSNVFTNVSNLRIGYDEACEALKLAGRENPALRIAHYSKYAVYHAIEICSGVSRLGRFCHPIFRQMSNSNKASDRDLMETLYYYFYFSKDANKVCEQLHIHRSTFFYRLKKIKEIFGDEFEDGETVFHILFSYHVAYFIEKMMKEPKAKKKTQSHSASSAQD